MALSKKKYAHPSNSEEKQVIASNRSKFESILTYMCSFDLKLVFKRVSTFHWFESREFFIWLELSSSTHLIIPKVLKLILNFALISLFDWNCLTATNNSKFKYFKLIFQKRWTCFLHNWKRFLSKSQHLFSFEFRAFDLIALHLIAIGPQSF